MQQHKVDKRDKRIWFMHRCVSKPYEDEDLKPMGHRPARKLYDCGTGSLASEFGRPLRIDADDFGVENNMLELLY